MTAQISEELRALVISEALPYIRQFHGEVILIKFGGSCLKLPELRSSLAHDLALLSYLGLKPILVHGGGAEIDEHLGKLGLVRRFVDGLRVTDEPTMEIVEMVLAGKVQKELVSLLNAAGAKAVGLTGKDGRLVDCVSLGEQWGMTGRVEAVDPTLLQTLVAAQFLPVISSVGGDGAGQSFNVNADPFATAIALAIKAKKLIALTDTPGLLADPSDPSSLISRLSVREAREALAGDSIRGGMRPKLEGAIEAIDGGVNAFHILDGRVPHCLLLELFTERGVGTMIEA